MPRAAVQAPTLRRVHWGDGAAKTACFRPRTSIRIFSFLFFSCSTPPSGPSSARMSWTAGKLPGRTATVPVGWCQRLTAGRASKSTNTAPPPICLLCGRAAVTGAQPFLQNSFLGDGALGLRIRSEKGDAARQGWTDGSWRGALGMRRLSMRLRTRAHALACGRCCSPPGLAARIRPHRPSYLHGYLSMHTLDTYSYRLRTG